MNYTLLYLRKHAKLIGIADIRVGRSLQTGMNVKLERQHSENFELWNY